MLVSDFWLRTSNFPLTNPLRPGAVIVAAKANQKCAEEDGENREQESSFHSNLTTVSRIPTPVATSTGK